MLKRILSVLLVAGTFSVNGAAMADVESTANNNDYATLNLSVNMTPDQTKISIPAATLNINPQLVRGGQVINVNIPVKNESQTATTVYPTMPSNGSFYTIQFMGGTGFVGNNLTAGQSGVFKYKITIAETIPTNTPAAKVNFELVAYKTQVDGGNSTVTVGE